MASYSSKSQQTTAPKNHNHRIAVLPPPARDALLKVRKASGYVFLTPRGKRLTGRTLHYHWDPIRNAVGKPEMALYELRHFAAAYLLNELRIPPHQVALQLGHTDGGVLVQRLYGHPSEVLARQAIKDAFGSNVVPIRPGSVAGEGA
jgi:integrase